MRDYTTLIAVVAAMLVLAVPALCDPIFPTLTNDFSVRIEAVMLDNDSGFHGAESLSMVQYYDYEHNRVRYEQERASGSVIVQYLYNYMTMLVIQNLTDCSAYPITAANDPSYNSTTGHIIASTDLLTRQFNGATPVYVGSQPVRMIPCDQFTISSPYVPPSGGAPALTNFSVTYSFSQIGWQSPSGQSQIPVAADFTALIVNASEPTSIIQRIHHYFSYFDYDTTLGGIDAQFEIPLTARCPSLNRSRDGLPTLPDQFTVNIEINLADDQMTVNAVEYFDRVNNRVRVDQTRGAFNRSAPAPAGGGFFPRFDTTQHHISTYYFYDQLVSYTVDDLESCVVTPITPNQRRERLDASGKLRATDFDYFTPWLHALNFTYAGTAVIRAINADKWSADYSGPTGPGMRGTINVDFFFTRADWRTRNIGLGVLQTPAALEFSGEMFWANGTSIGPILHRIVYTNLMVPREATAEDGTPITGFANSTFTPPTAARCPALFPKPLPAIATSHRSFTVSLEQNRRETRQTSAITEYYDYENGRVRLDRSTAIAGSIIVDVFDYARGVWSQRSSLVNRDTGAITIGSCAESPLTESAGYNATSHRLSDQNFDFFILTSSSLQYQYTGSMDVRGIHADVWSTVYTGPYLQYLQATLTSDWYFTADGQWSSFAIYANHGNPIPLRIHVEGTGIDQNGITTNFIHDYEYSNFRFQTPDPSLFFSCQGPLPLDTGSGGVSAGTLAGAIIISILGAAVIAIGVVHCYYRRRISRGDFNRLDEKHAPSTAHETPAIPIASTGTAATATAAPVSANPTDPAHVSVELDARPL